MTTQNNRPQDNRPVRSSPLFLPPMPPARLPARREGIADSSEDTEDELIEQGLESEEPEDEEHKSAFPETELSAEAEEEIFGLDDEDIMGGSSDFSDILGVDNERDILGRDPLKKRPRKLKRTNKRFASSPPTSIGSMQ